MKKQSKKFIDFLDAYSEKKNCDAIDYSFIINIAQIEYENTKLGDFEFTGKQNYAIYLPTKEPMQIPNYFPDISLNYYTMFEESKWNIDMTFLNNSYASWKTQHEAQFSALLEPKPVMKTRHEKIEADIKNIADLLSIINKYEYKDDVEYNFDLKSLHNIKTELAELNGMIGMETMKQSILDQLVYFIQELHIGKDSSDFKHTAIFGPPGTGKTEIAKIIGRMYSKLGILKKNVFKKVTRNDLIAGYLGQTAIKTKKVIDECIGGVLFIDEAYSLANFSDQDSYSKECLDILCESLSDHKNDLMVIIAGYEEELNETFFRVNKGLNSRFIWRFTMDPYSSKELMHIFMKKVEDQDWTFESKDDIKERWFEEKKDSFKNFGRDMESLLTFIKIAHGKRIYGKDKELRKKISIADMNKGYDSFIQNKKLKKQPNFMHTIYV